MDKLHVLELQSQNAFGQLQCAFEGDEGFPHLIQEIALDPAIEENKKLKRGSILVSYSESASAHARWNISNALTPGETIYRNRLSFKIRTETGAVTHHDVQRLLRRLYEFKMMSEDDVRMAAEQFRIEMPKLPEQRPFKKEDLCIEQKFPKAPNKEARLAYAPTAMPALVPGGE